MTVTGPKGTLERPFPERSLTLEITPETITVAPVDANDNRARALWGTYASHLINMMQGVTEGFTKSLEIEGVGYRAEVRGDELVVNVGYSHPVVFTLPEGVSASVEKNVVTLTSHDKERLGQFAANVRAARPPEPYKGKGIHYVGEYIIRKQGKKAG